ncbi:transcription activator MSS11-like isoform X2 [Amphibalanus amphitrite]|uniref:transcription activator MSS11-like isoform X2 n=1 Tax=Amphibalanus amphitrite TaxID=1232801 RepID=UPI001C91CDD6|nr:transcription activator MSS11-like isoform X2 [Amphibalanus amphitrite]
MHAAATTKRPPRVVTRSKSGAGAASKGVPHSGQKRDSRQKSSSESSTPSSPEISSGRAMYPPSPHHHQYHQYQYQHQYQHQQHQHHGQHPQQHHQQGRRHHQRARNEHQHHQQQQHQQQQLSPQHMETVRFLNQTWRTVQEECESSGSGGGADMETGSEEVAGSAAPPECPCGALVCTGNHRQMIQLPGDYRSLQVRRGEGAACCGDTSRHYPSSPDVSSLYYQEPAKHPALQDFKPFDLELFWGRQLHCRLTKGNS